MSADIDLRLKIETATHCALVSHGRAHGLDKFEVARLVLDAWADKQIHGARMLASCLRAKGEAGAAEGIARAAQGIPGQEGAALDWNDE